MYLFRVNKQRILGLMSGTSLDGLDLCLADFVQEDTGWSYSIIASQTLEYDVLMKRELSEALTYLPDRLDIAHRDYGTWLGTQAKNWLQTKGLTCDAIASHGHTVHHRPDQGYTFQLGAGQSLSYASAKEVICDFRSQDVAMGGQGAPLVPIGDELLFGTYGFCLNLGGICNVSMKFMGSRKAFDVGICNMLLNRLAEALGHHYDAGGEIAASGHLLPELLAALNDLEYYRIQGPKSTGVEWFNQSVWPLFIDQRGVSLHNIKDQLHTACHHIAYQIAQSINRFTTDNRQVLVTGGGAHNLFLIQCLQSYLPEHLLVVPQDGLVDAKEALIFAFMGALHRAGQVNCLAEVTGARVNSIAGVQFFPQ